MVDGYVVYPKGQASGSIYELAEPSGVEDYVAFDARPASPSIAYDVALGPKVAGLRLVGNQLEMLDAGGTPRLRVAPPSIVGSAGERADALLAVEGCAVDTNPAGPWGRTVTPPGAKRCRVRVSWAVDAVSYPALLDPRWQTTGSLSVARQDHNLIYLPLTGKVLAVGGRSSPTSTTGLTSAELYDKNSRTWSATSSMSGGRWSASATLLGSSSNGTTSQKVLIAGGINGSASLTTAQLYNQTAGTWAAAGTLNAARHLHTATLLNDGRVLVCGGMNGSTVLTSAALYNPASGSGSWAATTGPIPPPGWRFGTATLIATANQQLNGKVLLAGGNNGTSTISAVFLFDPAQSAFSTLASMPSPREGHQAVVLSDGWILFAGGKNGSTYLASSVIFDPSWGPGNWTAAGNMTSPRWGHAMNLLPSGVLHLGLVLVSGGSNGTSTLSSTEYWNGTNWATDGVMVAPVQQHVSVALGNSILIAGGAINNGSTTVSAAEVYDPSIALGCTSGSQCASGFCVSGVCCDSSCNSGCGSCNLAGHLGICTPLTSGTVCRALAGICDAAETCDGSSLACPNDAFQPPTTVCRASAGVCDVAETCTGASAACPQDGFASAATVCRPAAGACDRAENCTGTGPSCPADMKAADGTACNDGNACTKTDVCTEGTCGGTAYSCDDSLACTTDSCSGDGTCTHTLTAGNCLVAGACFAGGAANPANTCQICNPALPTAWSNQADGTGCNDGNACTQTDTCLAGACTGSNPVPCTASDQCHDVGTCAPSTGTCSNPAKPDGTFCDDGKAESQGDACTAGVCQGTVPCASVADVHVGTEHSCAVRTDGSLWCWGDNSLGQLGTGITGGTQPSPVRAGASTWNWTSVTTGGYHTCAIRRDGTLWCWGYNVQGQLGNGTNDATPTPTQVPGQGWTMVQAGNGHTCGVQGNGSLQCWGHNQYGALGNGTQSDSNVPVEVVGTNWVSVAAGGWHTCGIKSDQTLWCWGSNGDGQLGNGSPNNSLTPVQIGGANWSIVSVAVATGGFHTCGIKLDGGLWCWGGNDSGQLGTGSTSNSPTPVQVGSAAWTNISGGALYSCGVQGDGTLWSWGANDHWQLGDGTQSGRLAPVRVPGQAWAQVAAGNWHTCGRRQDGSLWCWGKNAEGEIGDGGTTVLQKAAEQVVGQLCSQVPICGNGQVEQGEQCDDGNTVSGDGCTWDCQIEKCFGVVCTASDECHEVGTCDPGTGTCSNPSKDDGTPCTNAPCMLGAACQAGVCNPGSPVECKALGECYGVGTCDPSTGNCSNPPIDKLGCNINLQVADRVVDMGGGKYIAIFGYDSTASGSFHPTTNAVSQQVGTTPQPPAYLLPGTHIGAFLPVFDGSAISWTVDSQTVTANAPDASHPALVPEPNGTGTKVDLPDGTTVILTPDLTPYQSTPTESTPGSSPTLGDVFNGVLSGQLSIGPTGAAIYTVPIPIPLGIAGMAPNLNLVYNSQGGDGIAGQGWELTGLSTIYRCPKTRVQDGYAQPVGMSNASVASDAGDGVCLDGKRLFYSQSSGTFTTEMADFSQITVDDAGKTFTVVTKTGETRYYGFKESARVIWPAGPWWSPWIDVVAVWALDRVEDPWGNYYDIEYNYGKGDFIISGIVVTSIKYTGHQSSAGGDEPPFYTVSFGYEPRPDVRHMRFGPATVPKNQRLTKISTPRGEYGLGYAPDNDRMLPSRLNRIHYCSTSDPGGCLQDLVFDWDGGGYAWDPVGISGPYPPATHDYGLPTHVNGKGMQFVDLDGDGRPDYIQAQKGSESAAWRNTGSGWEKKDTWKLPDSIYLGWTADESTGTMFADFDGDGLPDLITDKWLCTETTENCTLYYNKPVVWLNRIKSGQGWSLAPGFSGDSIAWTHLDLKGADKVVDINGDGVADLVRIGEGAFFWNVIVLLNTGSGWNAAPSYTLPVFPSSAPVKLFDLNRDGLPDLTGDTNMINTGDPTKGVNGTVWQVTTLSAPDPNFVVATGDVDGDGLYDKVSQQMVSCGEQCMTPSGDVKLDFAVGLGWSSAGSPNPYVTSLDKYWFWGAGEDYVYPSFGWPSGDVGIFNLVDLNADGLADVVVNQRGPTGDAQLGELLINTGSNWMDVDGFTSGNDKDPNCPIDSACNWQSLRFGMGDPLGIAGHQVPNSWGSDSYTDLDGDGVTDRIEIEYGTAGSTPHQNGYGAWLNKFRPPVIKGFPNGLANNTGVLYAVISTADAQAAGTYADSGSLDAGTRYFMLPLRVAASVAADNGVGGTSTTSYQYRDLRASATQHGPQGFKQVIVTDPTNMVTTTTYSQAYPYTGLPTSVERNNSGSVTKTQTQYCDNPAAAGDPSKCTPATGAVAGTRNRDIFVYPLKVTDTSYLRDSTGAPPGPDAETITTTTEYVYDGFGNPTVTTVTTESNGTGEKYQKTITNTYGDNGSVEQSRGKATKTVVTTTRLAPDVGDVNSTITHTTVFEYKMNPALVLARKKVEPDAGSPIESWTAYDNDEFGNITTTTSCASDFADCEPGVDNPQGDPNDPNHPLFRTTRLSYDPGDFAPGATAPVQTLSYGMGRYPVKTTNALNQAQFSAYDPLYGAVVQSTGPNGINTCYTYDAFGNQTQRKERCGSDHPLTTSVARYLAPGYYSPVLSKTITVTTPPTGISSSWVYADVLGRPVLTLSRDFAGGLDRVETEYTELGQVHRTSKPSSSYAQYWTTTTYYDWLGRPSTVTQDLGSIDGGATPATSTVTTTYLGSEIQTHQMVRGVARDRYEWKNVLGKVFMVIDAAGKHILYAYDPDGNLTKTTDSSNNTVQITYDALGRKKDTTDPDLGKWSYGYNGFGDLISQTDAKNQTITMTYDQLGRMTTKTDPAAGTAEWVYDQATAGGSAGIGKLAAMISAPDPNLKGPCTVPYTTQTSGNRAGRSFTYTPFGDVAQVDECIDSETFSTNYQYDNLGRQSVVTYPNVQSARFAAEYHYTSLGFLQYVADASDHTPYWVAKSMDATGQVTDEYTRNGVETVSTHNLSMGWLMDATTTAVADSNTLIQHWTNTYDEVGNLISRARSQPTNMADSIESFGYDHLDRLTSAEVKIPSESYDVTESYAFDSIGNLTQKGGKTYTYTGCAAGGGPHAVCTVDGSPGYSYDQNGNMVAGNGRTVTYNSFNKVSYIAGNQPTSDGSSPTVRFMYGADGNRVVQSVGTTTAGSEAARTVYVGMGGTGKSMYERTTHPTSGVTEHVHFLYAGGAHGGNAFALRVVTTGTQAGSNSSSDPQDAPTVAMRYQHFDHLGSVTASTDENGRVVGALGGAETTVFGYDAWGARRSPDGRPATGALDLQVGHREFTGHETIPSVGLVNMNGRVYDPELGRFLTPDPTVQFVADLQSYNRYSYVLNNPLRYTDPTGTFLGGAFDIFVNAVIMVAAVVVCAYSVGSGCVAAFALLATIYNTSSMVYSGVPFDQAIGIGLFGMAAGVVGGGAGAAFAQGIGLASQSMATAVVGGAIAGAYSSAMATIAFANGRGLGQNMLLGTASGALGAALAWSAQATNPVSEAAEANASGEGGGSGADKVETANQAAATRGITEDEEVREFGPSARASIARENYEFAIENMKASGELGGPVIGASGDPIYTAWTFQVSANMDYNIGPISVHLSVGLAADSSGGLAATYSAGGGAGAGAGASVSVGYDVSSGASVNDLGGPFATTETSVGLGPSASASGYTGKGSQGQQVGGNGWGVGVGVGGGTYTGGSVTKVWQIW